MSLFSKTNKAQVWSCGGGTQSCAIAALIVQGKLPKPDFSLIADTGYEVSETWAYANNVLIPELAKVGVDLVSVYGDKFGRYWKELSVNGQDPMLPVYSTESGDVVKLQNVCTQMWKIEVINKCLSAKGVTKSKRRNWIGFSWDEQRRWAKWYNHPDYTKGLVWFPLVELRLTRRQAIQIVKDMGWPEPPRSACYMCPNHSDHEWRRLKERSPEDFDAAVRVEQDIQKINPHSYLHRSCIPLDQVDFSQPEDLFSRPCDSGMCFV